MLILPAWKAQIASEKITILTKYSNYTDVFLKKLAADLFKQSDINQHALHLELDKQLLYRPIYSLKPVELETFKTYIEINIANIFICPFKSPAGALILIVWKLNGNLYLYVDYRNLNNLTIKSRYLLLLIDDLLDRFGQAKQFNRFDLKNVYH